MLRRLASCIPVSLLPLLKVLRLQATPQASPSEPGSGWAHSGLGLQGAGHAEGWAHSR